MPKLVVALFAIASSVFAQSQPPSKAPTEVGQVKQDKKNKENTVPKTSDQSPASVAQPIPPREAEKAKGESAKGTPSPVVVDISVPKSELNDLLLTLFTGGLVGVGYLQWRTLKAHHDVMKTSAEAAKSSAETLALQRVVMDTQAGHIAGMLAEIKKSADAAQSSAEIAKRSLYISQRPLITVDVTMAGGIYDLAEGTSEMDNLTLSFVRRMFRNVGTTVAREFYSAVWITGEYGRHLMWSSSRRPMVPGEAFEETTNTLVSIIGINEILGLTVRKTKVCGFVRYKTAFDELPGVYIEFHAQWDKTIRKFRVTTEEREDGGYPEPS
jgi:hypothetical protein